MTTARYWKTALAALAAFSTLVGPVRVLADGPTVQLGFDEGTGVAAADASGSGHGATLEGGAGWGPGLIGLHALSLPGTAGSDAVLPAPAIDTTRSYTVMAWVKFNSLRGYQTLLSVDGDQVSGFFLQLRGDSGRLGMVVLPGDTTQGNPAAIALADYAPEIGQWYHVAGVYDAVAHTLSLYVDGVLQQTVPLVVPWRANGPTAIGRGKYAGSPTDWVNGEIDDARFYQSALSGADILTLVKPSLPPPVPPSLRIEADRVTAHVSPTFYGLMTEEINHSYDGGLYAELIQNRAFRDDPASPAHWSLVQDGGAAGGIALDSSHPVSDALPSCLALTVTTPGAGGRVGAANGGYWGIPIMPHTRYRASLYAEAAGGFRGPLTLDLESSDGSIVYASARIPHVAGAWGRYTATLTTGAVAPTKDTRFVVAARDAGTVRLTLVSLFPPTYHDRPNGNRLDLMQRLQEMHPAFLRLPGGNYLEGNTIAERFAWKNTLGPPADRPGHQGPWGYRSSDGMGLLEFLEWCEDLHMQPVLAVYAGYSLGGEHVDAGAPLTPFVQDALDEIEYVTGGPNTHWGAERVRDGHPAPFPLTYVEVGNEDEFDHSGSYDGRFAQFFDAIRTQYPGLKIIATTSVKSRTPDVYDEHYYRSAADFLNDAHHYDNYSRTGPKVFVGEWASQEGKPTPDLGAALGDAAWMTGMERNSDVVVMESYAPLLVNVGPGGAQWGTNLIGYDALHSFGSPSYYAQALFSRDHGDEVLGTVLRGAPGVAESVTRDSRTGAVYVKLVNGTQTALALPITFSGPAGVSAQGSSVVLSGSGPSDTNSLEQPNRVVPVESPVTGLGRSFVYHFAPYSITVLTLRTKP